MHTNLLLVKQQFCVFTRSLDTKCCVTILLQVLFLASVYSTGWKKTQDPRHRLSTSVSDTAVIFFSLIPYRTSKQCFGGGMADRIVKCYMNK